MVLHRTRIMFPLVLCVGARRKGNVSEWTSSDGDGDGDGDGGQGDDDGDGDQGDDEDDEIP